VNKHSTALAVIAVLSYVAGGLLAPADPISLLFYACGIFPVGAISYFLGVLHMRRIPSEQRAGASIRNLTILVGVLVLASITTATVEAQREIRRRARETDARTQGADGVDATNDFKRQWGFEED